MAVPAASGDSLAGLQAEIDRCPFHEFLGLQAIYSDAGESIIRLPFHRRLGLAEDSHVFHGGVTAALVDIAAHAAVAIGIGGVAPTIDLRIDYLRTAQGEHLEALASVLRSGGSVACVDVAVRDPNKEIVVRGRGTYYVGKSG